MPYAHAAAAGDASMAASARARPTSCDTLLLACLRRFSRLYFRVNLSAGSPFSSRLQALPRLARFSRALFTLLPMPMIYGRY